MFRRFSIVAIVLITLLTPAAFASQAALVVVLENGQTITQCVTFEGPVITAFDLLQASGLEFTSQEFHFGQAICSIEGTGCDFPTEPCFCQSSFFSLFFLKMGQFESSHVGASHLIVHNGDVIAFAFGDGTAPTAVTFEEVCGGGGN
jgi:hypothetical protein